MRSASHLVVLLLLALLLEAAGDALRQQPLTLRYSDTGNHGDREATVEAPHVSPASLLVQALPLQQQATEGVGWLGARTCSRSGVRRALALEAKTSRDARASATVLMAAVLRVLRFSVA